MATLEEVLASLLDDWEGGVWLLDMAVLDATTQGEEWL